MSGDGCNIPSHFGEHQIVFDTTFCGDWAGAVWGSSGCANRASSCNDFVANNPGAFSGAYWSLNSLKVYHINGQADFKRFTAQTPSNLTRAEMMQPEPQVPHDAPENFLLPLSPHGK